MLTWPCVYGKQKSKRKKVDSSAVMSSSGIGKSSTSNPNNVVNDIYRSIVPLAERDQQKKDKVGSNVENVLRLIDRLIKTMKDIDSIFNALFMKINYSGSYWDGLRVREATEFDINIALKLPFKFNLEAGRPEYARLFAKDSLGRLIERNNPSYQHWLDIERKLFVQVANPASGLLCWYLDPRKVRSWIEGLIAKALDRSPDMMESGAHMVKAGPAFNLQLHFPALSSSPHGMGGGAGSGIDVDLVPSVYMASAETLLTPDQFPRTLKAIQSTAGWMKREFGLIPKPAPIGSSQIQQLEWRLCFKDLERDLIEGQKKPVIKLLKAFRDSNAPLQKLHSYALKITVLNMARGLQAAGAGTAAAFKSEANRGDDFLATLNYLHQCFEKGWVPSYWDPQANVIGKLGPTETRNMANFLHRVIQRLEGSANTGQCAAVWNSYFGGGAGAKRQSLQHHQEL